MLLHVSMQEAHKEILQREAEVKDLLARGQDLLGKLSPTERRDMEKKLANIKYDHFSQTQY